MGNNERVFRKRAAMSVLFAFALMAMFGLFSVTNAFGQTTHDAAVTEEEAEIAKFGLIAAAIAFGFGAIGAGIAIAHVGAAAMGAIGEKPEIASQALIFIALAEGLVVFGFITALMILGKF
jgi:V/A-type H+/Na+-transporting ATPase subunit K